MSLETCLALRKWGYRPHGSIQVAGRDIEIISYPYPEEDGGIGIMVREFGDPTTIQPFTIPPRIIETLMGIEAEIQKSVRMMEKDGGRVEVDRSVCTRIR